MDRNRRPQGSRRGKLVVYIAACQRPASHTNTPLCRQWPCAVATLAVAVSLNCFQSEAKHLSQCYTCPGGTYTKEYTQQDCDGNDNPAICTADADDTSHYRCYVSCCQISRAIQ